MTQQHDLNREHAEQLLRKAGEDEALIDEVLDSSRVSDEVIGFHCQQAAEKLLKAVLAIHGVVYRRTHDIDELLTLLQQNGFALPVALHEIDQLTPFAVEYRYQEWVDSDEALDRPAVRQLITQLRIWAEAEIGSK